MKKVLCIIIVLGVLFSLCSCKGLIKRTGVGEIIDTQNPIDVATDGSFLNVMLSGEIITEQNEENYVTMNMSWKNFKLSEEDEEKYPNLKDAFDELNREKNEDAKDTMEELYEAAEVMNGNKTDWLFLESEVIDFVQRADSTLFSCMEEDYIFAGGAHPNYFYKGLNFDTQTGDELILTDVIADIEPLTEILTDKLCEKYEDRDLDRNSIENNIAAFEVGDFQWTMDYQGVTFWFSPYDVAPYVVGAMSVKLYFDLTEADDKKDYIEIISNYDVNIDKKLCILINGVQGEEEALPVYDFDVYLVHMGDKNYVYSDSYLADDDHVIGTFEINGEVAEKINDLHNTGIGYVSVVDDDGNYKWYSNVFNNPSDLNLMRSMVVLGTRTGQATFKVSETDGKPEMVDEGFTFDDALEVKSLVPLKAKVLPNMEEKEIPKGTKLIPVLSDGETYVDLKAEDGTVMRLEIDASDWPTTIDGVPEEECFEGMMYAG